MAVCPKCGTEVVDLEEHQREMRDAQDPEHLENLPVDSLPRDKEDIL